MKGCICCLVLALFLLYVTHDPREAGLVGDSFSALVQGEIRGIHSAQEAFDLIKADYVSG